MNEKAIIALQQELSRTEEKISALNERIREVIWRQSPTGDRRQSPAGQAPSVAEGASPDVGDGTDCNGAERRLPQSARLAQLRQELAEAFRRYQDLHTLLRALRDLPPSDEAL